MFVTKRYPGGLTVVYDKAEEPCFYVRAMQPKGAALNIAQFPTEKEANDEAVQWSEVYQWVHVVAGTHTVLKPITHRYE